MTGLIELVRLKVFRALHIYRSDLALKDDEEESEDGNAMAIELDSLKWIRDE